LGIRVGENHDPKGANKKKKLLQHERERTPRHKRFSEYSEEKTIRHCPLHFTQITRQCKDVEMFEG